MPRGSARRAAAAGAIRRPGRAPGRSEEQQDEHARPAMAAPDDTGRRGRSDRSDWSSGQASAAGAGDGRPESSTVLHLDHDSAATSVRALRRPMLILAAGSRCYPPARRIARATDRWRSAPASRGRPGQRRPLQRPADAPGRSARPVRPAGGDARGGSSARPSSRPRSSPRRRPPSDARRTRERARRRASTGRRRHLLLGRRSPPGRPRSTPTSSATSGGSRSSVAACSRPGRSSTSW